MKNVCRKLKRFLAMLLITVTLVNTAVMSYSTAVNATSGVVTMGILDALYAMFGVSIGVGGQQAFFSQADLDYIITGARNGNVVQMGDYGEVDFSDSANVQRWLDTCAAVDGFLIGATTNNFAFGEDAAKQIRSNMLAIDMAAYKNTGTCASTALYDYITNFRVDTGDGLLDMQDACGLFSGDNENDNNNNIDWTKYAAISALLSAALISKATDLKDYFSSLVKPDTSEFTEYDEAFEEGGFCGWEMVDGQYHITGNVKVIASDTQFEIHCYDLNCDFPIYGYIKDNIVYFYKYVNNEFSAYNLSFTYKRTYDGGKTFTDWKNGGGSSTFAHEGSKSFNFPVFASYNDMKSYVESGDESLILNANDAYRRFKSNVHTAPDALKSALSKYFGKNPTADDFVSTANTAVSALDDNDGTTAALPAVADVLGEGITDGETDGTGDTTGTKDYTGVLGKIYNMLSKILDAILAIPTAIMELPDTIWSFFQDPLAAIKAAIDAIVAVLDPILEGVLAIPIAIMELPDLVWECFQDPITAIKSAVSSIPDALKAILDAILAIPEVIMALPELVWDCFADALTGVNTMPGILEGILEGILVITNPVIGIWELVKSIPGLLEEVRDNIKALAEDSGGSGGSGEETDDSNTRYGFINGIFAIIYILIELLFIFLHLFEFIVNIFKIPADPGYITGDFALGFNYIKTIELTGMGVSVYDFLMVLIHILVVFSVVKLLKEYISGLQM